MNMIIMYGCEVLCECIFNENIVLFQCLLQVLERLMVYAWLCLYFQVADLKKELKARGLNAVGNKTELVERLQLSLQGGKLF